jgi:hypothetical protein
MYVCMYGGGGAVTAGSSVRETAWGWMTHGTRLLTEGGFEGVYKQTFGVTNNEQLRKTYACYLSTSTGPVAGTLYISNLKFAFCSDRPLSYAPAPGEQAWSYYKVIINPETFLLSIISHMISNNFSCNLCTLCTLSCMILLCLCPQ